MVEEGEEGEGREGEGEGEGGGEGEGRWGGGKSFKMVDRNDRRLMLTMVYEEDIELGGAAPPPEEEHGGEGEGRGCFAAFCVGSLQRRVAPKGNRYPSS